MSNKTKMLRALFALSFISISGFAKTLVVSQIIDGEETIIAQKDISNDKNGAIRYNLCNDIPNISSTDYQRCESYIRYMTFKNGSTAVEFLQHEFVEFKQFSDRKMAIISEEIIGQAFLNKMGTAIISKTPAKTTRVFIK